MKKSKSLFEALTALKAVTQTLLKKMPVLFLVVVYLIDLGIRSYLSAGWSTTYLLGVLILIISIGIYVRCTCQQILDTKNQKIVSYIVRLYKPYATLDIAPRNAGQIMPTVWTHEQIILVIRRPFIVAFLFD